MNLLSNTRLMDVVYWVARAREVSCPISYRDKLPWDFHIWVFTVMNVKITVWWDVTKCSIFRAAYPSTLKMDALYPSETLALICHAKRQHVVEYRNCRILELSCFSSDRPNWEILYTNFLLMTDNTRVKQSNIQHARNFLTNWESVGCRRRNLVLGISR